MGHDVGDVGRQLGEDRNGHAAPDALHHLGRHRRVGGEVDAPDTLGQERFNSSAAMPGWSASMGGHLGELGAGLAAMFDDDGG